MQDRQLWLPCVPHKSDGPLPCVDSTAELSNACSYLVKSRNCMAQQGLKLLQMRAGVEMFKKTLNEGQAGDNVGLLLRGVKREDVLRGQVCLHHGCLQAQASICRSPLSSMQQLPDLYQPWEGCRASDGNKTLHTTCTESLISVQERAR